MADQTVAVRHSAELQADDPGAVSLAYLSMQPAVEICRDVMGGTLVMRARGRAYLPQFPKEEDEQYAQRLGQAVLFNAFAKTVKSLTGMVFRKPIALGEDFPEPIKPHLENIDLAGRHIDVFARDAFQAGLRDGHCAILVDWSGPEGASNRLEEETSGARPYWVLIEKRQILRWRTENRDGRIVLTSFAYRETDMIPDGEFRDKEIERVRQYDLEEGRVRYRSWTRNLATGTTGGQWTPETDRVLGERMKEIPVAVDYAERTGYLMSEPPLLDLALENVRHYQLRSDRDNNLHVASVPIFVTKGVDAETIGTFTVGPAIGLALPNAESDAVYVETSGAALASSREELQDIEQRMAALGLATLVRRDRVQRTATEAATDKLETDSDLMAMARATEDAIEEALRLHAAWMGLDDGGSVELNKDFRAQELSPQMVAQVSAMVAAEQLSIETMWDILRQGEVLPDTFDPELERERIQEQGASEVRRAIQELQRAAGNGGQPEPDDATRGRV